MAKKNKNTLTPSEPLISNAPLMDAQLDTDTNVNRSSKKVKTKKTDQKMKAGARIRKTFKEMFSELKKVSWPTAKKTFSMFGIVLVVVLFFLVVISAFDYGIINLVELLMKHSVV